LYLFYQYDKGMAFTLSPSQNVVNPGSMIGSNSKNMSMPMNNNM